MREVTVVLLFAGLLASSAVSRAREGEAAPAPTQNRTSSNEGPGTSVESLVAEAYVREFGEAIPRPAIYRDPSGGGCGVPYLTTTAYLRASARSARVLHLFMTPDGRSVIRKSQAASIVIPAGMFRVLTVITQHPATVDDSTLPNWEAAQAKINRDHAVFATGHGRPEPIVSFENTNVLVPVGDIDPKSLPSIRTAVERRGFQPDSYQFVASINLDPARSEGGFAGAGGFIYMGNYSRWSGPLTAAQWINVADAVYHHEVSHHWGWPGSHDWAPQCAGRSAYRPFIVPPILFGWDDIDGDRVPELLDATPYGRPQ